MTSPTTAKSLTNLVDDIYALLGQDKPLTEEQAEQIGEEVKAVFKKQLVESASKRPALSMSSLGSKCWRQLWYKHNKPECLEKIPPHTKLKFLYGHILEALLLGLAKATGWPVRGEQDTLSLHGIQGHRDAVIGDITVDVKSANSRSFNKFKNHELETNDPFGYIDQLSCYVKASEDGVDKTRGAFLAIDQELGHITVDEYEIKDKDYAKQIAEMQSMLAKADPPARPFKPEPDGKSGNEAIPLNCRYCAAKEECWKDANGGRGLIKYIYSNGPRWFTRVTREPRVPVVRGEEF